MGNITTLNEFKTFVDHCKLSGYNWTGDKRFSVEKKSVSMSELIDKLDQLYHAECFKGAQLSESECQKLAAIKGSLTQLEQQTVRSHPLTRLYLSVIGIASAPFSLFSSDKKGALLQEITISSEKPSEALLLSKTFKTNLSQPVKDALQDAYDHHYSTPYTDHRFRPSEEKCKIEGQTILRYNHGLAHTARKTYYIPFVVEYLKRQGNDNLSQDLEKIIAEEGLETFIQKLQIVMAFEVAGRKSECGSRDNLAVYQTYLDGSRQAFIDYCNEKNLVGEGKLFKDKDELSRYADAIKNKYPNRFKEEQMDVITVIVDMTHTLDEFRCYAPSRMKGEIEEINHHYTKNKNNRDLWELAKFCQKAVAITGDRLKTEYQEGLRQRKPQFTFGDLKALYRNFVFRDEKTFLKCSTDFEYCWDLLQKLPPPVFFSQGETTYSYLTEKPVKAETRSIEEQAQEALEVISEGNAAIRLLNTQPEKFGFEMKMINDPVFMRPVRRVYGQRDWVLNDRANGNMFHRGFKQRQSLRTQLQTPQQPSSTLWPAVHHDGDRGQAKLTEDSKKVSFTMLRRDAQIVHFKGEFKEYTSYRPVGILVEVDETNPKNQKFVFNNDAATSYKFWVGENANQMVGKLRGRNSNLSIAHIRNELDEQIQTGTPPEKVAFYEMQHANNEILMPYRKSAIKAMFATEDTAEARVRTFLHTVYLEQDYGKKVPVLVIDGEKQPRAYTFDDLYADLVSSELSLGLRHDLEACFFSSLDHVNNEELLKHCKTLFSPRKADSASVLV